MNSMKKLLSALATFGLTTITGTNVIACSSSSSSDSGILEHSFNDTSKVALDDFADTGLTKNNNSFDFNFGTSDIDGLKSALIKKTIIPISGSRIFGVGKLVNLDKIPVDIGTATDVDLYAAGVYGENKTGLIADSEGIVNVGLSLYLFKSVVNSAGPGYIWQKQADTPMAIKLEVITTKQSDISNIIINSDLGEITISAAVPSLNELLVGIKAKNPSAEAQELSINNLKIKDGTTVTPTTATVIGFGELTGEVNLTYKKSVTVDLNDIIKQTNLGSIIMHGTTPTATDLLVGIQLSNPGTTEALTTSNFIVGSTTNTAAYITGTGIYKGRVDLTYSQQNPDISTIITTVNLGIISFAGATPTLDELLTIIKATEGNEKATGLMIDDIKFQDGTIPTPTSATISGQDNFTGNVTLTYEKKESDIAKIITTVALGPIAMAGSTPTIDELLVGIRANNPSAQAQDLTTSDIKIKDSTIPSATSATIVGIGQYSGEVTLSYSKILIDINTVITQTTLGAMIMHGDNPTLSDIFIAIKLANPDTTSDLTQDDFTIGGYTNTYADITGNNSSGYTGSLRVNYTKQNSDISTIITNLDLGAITMAGATPTLDELLTAIKVKNPNAQALRITDIKIKEGTSPSATTAIIDGSADSASGNFTGEITVTYSKA